MGSQAGPVGLDHHLQAKVRWCAGEGGGLHLLQTVQAGPAAAPADLAAVLAQDPDGMRRGDAEVDADQAALGHRDCTSQVWSSVPAAWRVAGSTATVPRW